MIIFTTALLAMTSVEPVVDIPEPRPSMMSKTEIRDHNAKLDRKHRYYTPLCQSGGYRFAGRT